MAMLSINLDHSSGTTDIKYNSDLVFVLKTTLFYRVYQWIPFELHYEGKVWDNLYYEMIYKKPETIAEDLWTSLKTLSLEEFIEKYTKEASDSEHEMWIR